MKASNALEYFKRERQEAHDRYIQVKQEYKIVAASYNQAVLSEMNLKTIVEQGDRNLTEQEMDAFGIGEPIITLE